MSGRDHLRIVDPAEPAGPADPEPSGSGETGPDGARDTGALPSLRVASFDDLFDGGPSDGSDDGSGPVAGDDGPEVRRSRRAGRSFDGTDKTRRVLGIDGPTVADLTADADDAEQAPEAGPRGLPEVRVADPTQDTGPDADTDAAGDQARGGGTRRDDGRGPGAGAGGLDMLADTGIGAPAGTGARPVDRSDEPTEPDGAAGSPGTEDASRVASFDGPLRTRSRDTAGRSRRRTGRDRPQDARTQDARAPETVVAPGEVHDPDDVPSEPRGGRRAPRGGRGRSRDGARRGAAADTPPATPAEQESRAKEICLRLLTDRARTVKELGDALRRKEIPDDIAHRVLERFDEVGLVDDKAFADQWVRSRHRFRGLGKRAIAVELRRKGVDSETAEEALTEIDDDSERERARELVARRLRSLPVGSREERQSTARKLVGMLARKGYGPGVAYGVVKEEIAAAGADAEELGEAPPED
ncbi:RecX family transcriptional regulator [Pseudonocardia nematodicida]|uniref:Regulatory protein RecX n=1 Tax=Pseudonocardia nematodicida TaxID=1206997 RepID=A0ABV1KI42_9PSEU